MTLSRIRVVLVGTQHPGNLGAAARAMKTMGLRELTLVAPQAFPDPRADAMAVGAVDLLQQARVCASLDEAIGDCARVVATSARPRHISAPVSEPREWARQFASANRAGTVALLFGRERTGLTNEELDRAQELLVIPTADDFTSLNLAAAVQIICYELQMAIRVPRPPEPVNPEHLPAGQADMERFYTHLERVLIRTQFLNPDNPRLLMRRMRRLYGKAAPDMNEINILRGTLTSVEDQLRRERAAGAGSLAPEAETVRDG